MNEDETNSVFHNLLYQKKPYYGLIPKNFTVDEFIYDILQFGENE
jgi:hypothetical protein